MSQQLRLGILGTGNIARQFAQDLVKAEHCTVTAVGSRHVDSARSFAQTYGIGHHYGSYDQLIGDDQIDGIYVSLPNSLHHEWTVKALQAGKHVLCEKPLGRNVAESEQMFDTAESAGLVLTEAFVYRSHPMTHAVMQQLKNGAIGQLRAIRTNFCFATTTITDNIRFNSDLAGGSLMDVGCYCINFSRYFAGSEPVDVHAVAHLHESGIDDFSAAVMQFGNGVVASFNCGMTVQADNTAYLCGEQAYIEVPIPWKPPDKTTFCVKHSSPPRQDKSKSFDVPPVETFKIKSTKPIFAHEADDFAATVLYDAPPRITSIDSIANMRILDEMRRQAGVPF